MQLFRQLPTSQGGEDRKLLRTICQHPTKSLTAVAMHSQQSQLLYYVISFSAPPNA